MEGEILNGETFTGEAHESALSGLLPQALHVLVVDVDQVDGLQSKSFGGHDHLLPGVEELPGIFGPRGTWGEKIWREHRHHVGLTHAKDTSSPSVCISGRLFCTVTNPNKIQLLISTIYDLI